MDDELSELFRERKRRAECETAGLLYVPDELALRKAEKCAPEGVPPLPDVLFPANNPTAPTVPERLLPGPLVISSPLVTVFCADHGGGVGSASSNLGESLTELYLDDLPEVTRSELYRVTDNQVALQAAIDVNLEDLAAAMGSPGEAAATVIFDTAIMLASTVEATAAAAIRMKALELRGLPAVGLDAATGLYAIAELTALSRLVCEFSSEELWVVCNSAADTGFDTLPEAPLPLPPADRYRLIPAEARKSTTSVEDANDLAVIDAVSDPDFTCVYLNTAVTADCATDVDASYAHTYTPAFTWGVGNYASLAALSAGGFTTFSLDSLATTRPLIYTATIGAGLYTAASQEDANARAREVATQQLDCYFPSRATVIDCANRSASNPVVTRINQVMAAFPFPTETAARATVFAEMDSEYLTDIGLVTNVGLTVVGAGRDIDISEGLRVALPAGLVASVSSQSDADEEARLHALGFLDCRWVSPEVTCSCEDLYSSVELTGYNVSLNTLNSSPPLFFAKGALGSSEDGPIATGDTLDLCKASLTCIYCNNTVEPRCHIAYDSGGVTYDLWSLPHSDLGLPIDIASRAGVSPGVSAGLPAGIICDSDPRLVDTIATSTGSLPPLINSAPSVPVCLYGNREVSITCVEKVGAKAFALTPSAALRTLIVAVGSFEAATQEEADDLADAFVNAALICEFGNPQMTVLCGGEAPTGAATQAEYLVPVTYGTGLLVSADATGGVGTPLVVAAHVFTSLESPESARATALQSLFYQLDCFWKSAAVNLRCTAPRLMPPEVGSYTEQQEIRLGDVIASPPREPLGQSTFSPSSRGYDWGEVSTAAGDVTSYTDQADANRQAYSNTWAQLDCFFLSARVSLSCVPPNFPTAQLLLQPETGFIGGGSEPEVTITEAQTFTSYFNQADANMRAYQATKAQLNCDNGKDHAFGLSGFGSGGGGGGGGGGNNNCCKVKFSDLMLEAGVSVLYSPEEAGSGLASVVPGHGSITPGVMEAERCGDFPAYFYLEAQLHKRSGAVYAQYWTTQCDVKVHSAEMPLVEGAPGSYNLARRLIAHVNQKDSNSSFDRDSKNNCAGLKIVQLVTSPQKLTSSKMGGVVVPAITDADSPLGGGGAELPFAVSIAATDPVLKLAVTGGRYQVGATGNWVTVAATPATAGSYAYFVIEQDETRVVTSVSVLVTSTAQEAVVVSGSYFGTANAILARVEGSDLTQYRHGNFTLGLWQLNGDVLHWPETLAGSVPTV